MNDTSSRSHTILHVDVYQTKSVRSKFRSIDPNEEVEQIQARLVLVDLAGSERVRRTTSKGQRLVEAKHINQSLSILGNVIQSLSLQQKNLTLKRNGSMQNNQQFIPYRSSKLTRVLQNSLGPTSKIVVMATLGPHHLNYQESLSTL